MCSSMKADVFLTQMQSMPEKELCPLLFASCKMHAVGPFTCKPVGSFVVCCRLVVGFLRVVRWLDVECEVPLGCMCTSSHVVHRGVCVQMCKCARNGELS
mmetsp:Transcript_18880/g.27588  ORF Transcript_18880/g.27588 Transcript_18880/m.27588 type:complete len:100 (+) Transcript_18880:157-456(+)